MERRQSGLESVARAVGEGMNVAGTMMASAVGSDSTATGGYGRSIVRAAQRATHGVLAS